MASIDRRADRALFRQIADLIGSDIREGRLTPGTKLASEREMAELYGVDRTTVRQAVAELRRQNLVTAQHGKGIFVRENTPVRRTARTRLTQRDQRGFWGDLEDAGLEARVVTDIDTARPAHADVAALFGIAEQSEVLVRARHMSAGDTPLQLAETWIHPDVAARIPRLAELDTGPGGFLARLEEAGYVLDQRFVVRARQPRPEETTSLRLDEGSAILSEDWIIRDQNGTVLAVTYVAAAGDRNEFVYAG